MEEGSANFAAASQQRARVINKKHHQRQEEDRIFAKTQLMAKLEQQYGKNFTELRQKNMGELWRKFVTTKDEAISFMELMYPQFPTQVQRAYVHMFERAIRGEIQLQEDLLYKGEAEEQKKTWDPMADIEEERAKGLENVFNKKLDALLIDEKWENEAKEAKEAKTKKQRKKTHQE